MNVLVVYYSRTGTTRTVANVLAKELNCDLEEIIDEKSRAGPLGWLGGGKDASQNKLTQIKLIKQNPKNYDLVIVGSPIWAGKMAPAIRTYLTQNKPKKLAEFCTIGGENAGVFLKDLEESFGKTKAFMALQTKAVNNGKFGEKIKEFVMNFY